VQTLRNGRDSSGMFRNPVTIHVTLTSAFEKLSIL